MHAGPHVRHGRSVAQEFVDGNLGTRLLVDLFHDHRAVERWPAGRARHRAGDDNRIGRHLAVSYFSAGAVDDAGRGADIDAH